MSVAHYTGGKVNELSRAGQYKMHQLEYLPLKNTMTSKHGLQVTENDTVS